MPSTKQYTVNPSAASLPRQGARCLRQGVAKTPASGGGYDRPAVANSPACATITHLEDLDRLYAVVKEKHGHIDALFANAGWGEVAQIGAATEAHFDKTFDLNAKGTFFTVQKAIPLFKD